MCRSAKQVTVSSAKSFALQCKQIAFLCKKTRNFPKHKLMVLQSFVQCFLCIEVQTSGLFFGKKFCVAVQTN